MIIESAKIRTGLIRIGYHKIEAIDIYSSHTIAKEIKEIWGWHL